MQLHRIIGVGGFGGEVMPIALEMLRKIHDELVARGIKPRKYFYPLTVEFDYLKVADPAEFYGIPVAVDVAKRVLCLPLFPSLREEDLEEIVRVVKDTESSAA